MSTDPIETGGQDRADPTCLPLFTHPAPMSGPPRPGRVRGTFTMHPAPTPPAPTAPVPAPPAPARLDEARRRHHGDTRSHRGPTPAAAALPPAAVAPVAAEGIDWGLVTAFRTVVAQRLVQAGVADRAGQEAFGRQAISRAVVGAHRRRGRHRRAGLEPGAAGGDGAGGVRRGVPPGPVAAAGR